MLSFELSQVLALRLTLAILLLQLCLLIFKLLLQGFELQFNQLQTLFGLDFLLFQLDQTGGILLQQRLLLLQGHFQFSQFFLGLLPFALQRSGLLNQTLEQFTGAAQIMFNGGQFGTYQLKVFPERIHLKGIFFL